MVGSTTTLPTRRRNPFHRLAALLRPEVISTAAILVGVVMLVGVLAPDRFRTSALYADVVPMPARATAEAVVAVSGWILLRLARGLRKRKRAEWRIAVCVCVAVLAADLLRAERRPVEAVVTGLLLAALIATRREYTVPTDPHGRWFALRFAGQLVVPALGLTLILLYLPGHVPSDIGFWARAREAVWS